MALINLLKKDKISRLTSCWEFSFKILINKSIALLVELSILDISISFPNFL